MAYSEKAIPEVAQRRLPRYYRYISELKSKGVSRISSAALSREMNVTASQIRQDFNYFGGFGQQGYGYNVESLYEEIGHILGLDKKDSMIILGAGNLGRALANHAAFARRGFELRAVFDSDPNKIGKRVNKVEVLDIAKLGEYLSDNKIDIAILAVPKGVVPEIYEVLKENGVKGILNFAYMEIESDPNLPIENVHISDSLMMLSYRIKQKGIE